MTIRSLRIALAALVIAAVRTITAVVAQSSRWFSEMESECDKATVVFAKNVGHENHTALRNLSLTAGDSRITARWDPPELPGNPNFNGYQVQYREVGGEWRNANHRGTATEAATTGLANGNTYEVRVAAVSAPGGKSGYTRKSASLPQPPLPEEPCA